MDGRLLAPHYIGFTVSCILHITSRDVWEQAFRSGRYEDESLRAQGFIHCSGMQQVIRVANSLFRGRQGLVLLCVNPDKLPAEVRYENCEGGAEMFPHIYGPIPAEAVERVVEFPPEPDGTFVLPETVCSRD